MSDKLLCLLVVLFIFLVILVRHIISRPRDNASPPPTPTLPQHVVNLPPSVARQVLNHPRPTAQISIQSQTKPTGEKEVVINVYNEQVGGERECSICLSEFEECELIRSLPAIHNWGF
ncbi:E3 ubiquitin-protein ligase [Forsythia ovata]|uniref:E3 ubiquitin-protein ligase n=1 Tax=Forsythia ovata TaxID=205694 RepID=A0ABD1T6K1_9LAMI